MFNSVPLLHNFASVSGWQRKQPKIVSSNLFKWVQSMIYCSFDSSSFLRQLTRHEELAHNEIPCPRLSLPLPTYQAEWIRLSRNFTKFYGRVMLRLCKVVALSIDITKRTEKVEEN
uniref:Uncharacterized protein n=1 Tax=Romanomermis culicivorax TaxID=13658 RepID=A0A915K6S2_ROMCU